jgi:DNA helicase-4
VSGTQLRILSPNDEEILASIQPKQAAARQALLESLKVQLERQGERQVLLKNLKVQFEQDFLNAYNFYQNQCSEHISFNEYQTEKLEYVRSWIQRRLNPEKPPDLEQAAAIGAVEGHVQVVARAGSGKTSTLVNRALFLQQHCGIAPSEMLLLAFNRKAAEEIRERLAARLQESIPHVMTFHALAYALVRCPENQENIESILFDEPDGEQSRSRALQDVIDAYLCNPYLKLIRKPSIL